MIQIASHDLTLQEHDEVTCCFEPNPDLFYSSGP